MADLQFNKTGTEQKSSSWIRTYKTGDQPYSDTSPNGDFSLDQSRYIVLQDDDQLP